MQSWKARADAVSQARRSSLGPGTCSSARPGFATASKPTNRRCFSVFRTARCSRRSIFGARRSNPPESSEARRVSTRVGGRAPPNRGETVSPEQQDERGQDKLRPPLQSAAPSRELSGNLRSLGRTIRAGPRQPRLLFGRALRPERSGKDGRLSRAGKEPRAFYGHQRRILALVRQE